MLVLIFLICVNVSAVARQQEKPPGYCTTDGEIDDQSSMIVFL